jgi:hypothetical protein
MNYDNITIDNFKNYETHLINVIFSVEQIIVENELEDFKRNKKTILVDEEGNDFYKKSMDAINIGFTKIFKFSHSNNVYFIYCSSITFENTFNERFQIYKNNFIDVNLIDFIESEYSDIVNWYGIILEKVNWNIRELDLLKNAERKKLKFLENLLLENNCTVETEYNAHGIDGIGGKTDILVKITEHKIRTPVTNKQKTNKSLLFNGKELNLSERFKIANAILGIDKKIRTLNIQDLEKYQLLAYILGCDKDNARNLMNGSYKTKDRDLSTYFNDLGLNK